MRRYFAEKYQAVSWLGFILLVVILSVISGNVIRSFHASQIAEVASESEQHLNFISQTIHEKLQQKDYVSVRTLLLTWAEQHSKRSVELSLTMANGYVLAKYDSDKHSPHTLAFTETIDYSYRDSATLLLNVDLSSAYFRTAGIIKIVGALILIFSLLLACALWFYLRKYALSNKLNESSISLANTVDALHREVEAHKEAEGKLQKTEYRFRTLLNQQQDAIFFHKLLPGGFDNFSEVNDSAVENYGYSYEEFQQLSPTDITLPLKEGGFFNVPSRDQLLKTGQATFEVTHIKKSGEQFPVEINASVVEFENEKYILSTARDISQRKQAEIERLQLEEQLQQKYKMETVGYMAGGMAHNFNNNLSIILGNLELSELKEKNPQIKDYLNSAKTAVLRSRDLVQNIITYSRQGNQRKSVMKLTEIIDETLSLLSATLPTTIKAHKYYCPSCETKELYADPSQIQEILINLCNNAVHAMDEKGELDISVKSVALRKKDISSQYDCVPGDYAKLSIRDTGCGMKAEMLNKIFDPFYSTKEEHEGAGMGLATVQGIVAQHGGMIRVDSQLNKGTTFELYFPLKEENIEEDKAAVLDDSLPIGTEHILFVDDDPVLADLGMQMLSQVGYNVSMMTDSQKALELFTAHVESFDLVITDQTMPDLTGEELIRQIKQIRSNIPSILCTGFSSKIDEDKAKEQGISAFMMKPLDMPTLLQTVKRVLDGESNNHCEL